MRRDPGCGAPLPARNRYQACTMRSRLCGAPLSSYTATQYRMSAELAALEDRKHRRERRARREPRQRGPAERQSHRTSRRHAVAMRPEPLYRHRTESRQQSVGGNHVDANALHPAGSPAATRAANMNAASNRRVRFAPTCMSTQPRAINDRAISNGSYNLMIN